MVINVNVVNQELKVATNLRCLAEGSQKFVQFKFNLHEDWDGLTVFAQFVQGENAYNAFLDENNCAFLPSEIVAGKCYMMLYGTGNQVIATTNFLTLCISENHFVSDAESTKITETLYQQLVDIVKGNKQDMLEALAEAVNNFEAEMASFEEDVNEEIAQLRSAIGSPLVATTASEMTDHSKVYVYTGSETGYTNGHWYYWNGTAWVDGGQYNSQALETDKTLTLSDKAADAKVVGDAINEINDTLVTKANVDGYYEDMTVGNAEQLVSSKYIEDSGVYSFRTSGGSVDIGNREYNEVVGGSLGWNQLVQNGDFSNDLTGWTFIGDVTATAEDGAVKIVANSNNTAVLRQPENFQVKYEVGHKYLISSDFKQDQQTTNPYHFGLNDASLSNSGAFRDVFNGAEVGKWFTKRIILEATENWKGVRAGFYSSALMQAGEIIYLRNIQIFDLTAMFGSTIADYIYSLETANAGDGVAWFKHYFPMSYYNYNAGELASVRTDSHNMTGFNQWDEEWEVGAIVASTGQNAVNSTCIRSKNYIRVLPGTTYYVHSSVNASIFMYDVEKKYLGSSLIVTTRNNTFETDSRCHYIRFYLGSSYGTVYKNDICINLSWSGKRDGEYEPYEKHVYPLDTSLELRGFPSLDANNNLSFDGDVYKSDGTVTRKYGIVDLGTLSWTRRNDTKYSVGYYFQSSVISGKKNATTNQMCSKYPCSESLIPYTEDKICWSQTNSSRVFITDSSYSDATTLKTALSGVYLVYEKENPTTEEAEPFAATQTVNDFGTEEYIDHLFATGERDVIIPHGHNTKYIPNYVDKLDHLPNLASDDGLYIVRQEDTQMYLENVETALTNKAEIDGYYDEMTVGHAEQLISSKMIEDSAPYLMRTSGGTKDIGDTKIVENLVGGSVVWNQLVRDNRNTGATEVRTGITFVKNADGSWAISGTPADNNAFLNIDYEADNKKWIKDHIYYVKGISSKTGVGLAVVGMLSTIRYVCDSDHDQLIKAAPTASNHYSRLQVHNLSGQDIGTVNYTPQIYDLTALFGSAIADYLYTIYLEDFASAPKWLYDHGFITKPYYPYTLPTFAHVSPTAMESIGFNAWDEEWEVGTLDGDTGLPIERNTSIRCKNYIPVLPNTTYYYLNGSNISFNPCLYDSDKNYIGRLASYVLNGTFVIPSNAHYMKFALATSYGATYKNDICINLSWSGKRNGEYEPYEKHTYALDDSLELRGKLLLDENNEIRYSGDTYSYDGTVTRKYALVDLGTLNWTMNTTYTGWFSAPISDMKSGAALKITLGDARYLYWKTAFAWASSGDVPDLTINTATNNSIYIHDSAYSDKATFVESLNGVYLLYELATPVTEEAEPFSEYQNVDDYGIELFVDERDVPVPVGHTTKYPANLVDKLDHLPSISEEGDGLYLIRQDGTDLELKNATSILDSKANIDGYYENLTVGSAEQLLSNQYINDSVPYNLRTTGGSADVGDRKIVEKIVGGTIAWNQLVNPALTSSTELYGITFTNNKDGSFTISGTATDVPYYNLLPATNGVKHIEYGHKYLFLIDSDVVFMSAAYTVNGSTSHGGAIYRQGIISGGNETATRSWVRLRLKSGDVVNDETIHPQVFDLTAMFGSTIADYIHSIEQATAGAGVAWFRRYFPKEYYDYSEPTFIHSKISAMETVGFNQWDEEWESGQINADNGANLANANCIRSKNYIPTLSGERYYFKTAHSGYVSFYDENKNFISPRVSMNNNAYTVPSNAKYMRFFVGGSSDVVNTYASDICINISDPSSNGTYEPYKKHTYAVENIELKGIAKLNSNNELYFDGDTYESSGKHETDWAEIDLGTLTWNYVEASFGAYFYAGLPAGAVSPISGGRDGFCTKYPIIHTRYTAEWGASDKAMTILNNSLSGTKRAFIRDTAYTDATALKTALSGVMLLYPIIPTTSEAEPFQQVQVVDSHGTESMVDDRDVSVPMGHVSDYPPDMVGKLNHLPNLASGNGDYIIRQTSGQMSLVQAVSEFPAPPVEDGTYQLRVVMSNGNAVYSWVSA